MELLRNRLSAAKTILAADRTEGEKIAVSSAQCSAVVCMSKRHKLEAEDLAELNGLASEVNWHPSHRAVVLAALCAPLPAATSHVGRRSLQDFKTFMDFLSKGDWKAITGGSLTVVRRKVMQRLIRLGARCLNERSLKLASSFCLFVHHGDDANSMEQLKSELTAFKRDFKALADAAEPPVEYLLELPESPAMLLVVGEATYNAAYGVDPAHGPVSCQIDASKVRAFDNAVKCRGTATHGLQSNALSLNAPIAKAGGEVNMFMQGLQFMSQMMSGMQGTPFMTCGMNGNGMLGGMHGNGMIGGMQGSMRGEGAARGRFEGAKHGEIELEILKEPKKDSADALEAAGCGAIVAQQGPPSEKRPADISVMLDKISKKAKGIRPLMACDGIGDDINGEGDGDAATELGSDDADPPAPSTGGPKARGRSTKVLKRPAAAKPAARSKAGAPSEKPTRGRPRKDASPKDVPTTKKKTKPHWSVEWSRSQIMCRTGQPGPGQCEAIRFGKGTACRTVDAAVEKARRWVEKAATKSGKRK